MRALFRMKLLAICLGVIVGSLPSGPASAQPPQTGTGSPATNLQGQMQKAAGLLQRGESEEAEAELQAILEVAPKHGPANLMLGQIRLQRGDLDAARGNFEIAVGSNVRRPYLAWHFLGRTQLESGQPEEALESFGKALENTPQFGPALLGRSKAAIRLGNLERAASDLDEARNLEDSNVEAALLLAEVLLVQEREDEAVALLGPLAQVSSESTESLAARMLLLSLGDEAELKQLHRLVGESLYLARSYLALGLAESRIGETQTAARAFRIALEIDDQDPVPWLLLQATSDDPGLTSYPDFFPDLEGKLERARKLQVTGESVETEIESILGERPFHVPARLSLVLEAEAREDPWKALAGYQQVVEWLPEIPSLQARAARVAHTLEAEDLASCLARRALRSMPEEAALYYLLAAIESEAGEWEASSESCRKAIGLGLEEAPLYLTLGRVEFEQMHIGESIAAYAKAVELDPDADRAVPRFALATLSTVEFDALRGLMAAELERDPKGENTLYSLGLMSLRENEFEAAVDYFEQLAALLPEDTQVQHHLGTAYMREGDKEKGKVALERFRELKAAEEEAWVEHNQAYRKKLEAQDAVAAGDRDEALRIYYDLASIGLAEPDDYLAAGSLYLEAGDFERAFGWYEQFLTANPYKREALEGLAAAAEGLGRDEVAARSRTRAELLNWPCTVE